MKYLIKTVIFNAAALYLLSLVLPAIKYNNLETLIYAALVFGLLNIFVKPLLKLLTFPLNLVTFGLASSFLNVFLLYLVTLIVPQFLISPFSLKSLNLGFWLWPDMELSLFWAYLFVSFLFGLLNSLLWAFLG